MNLTGCNIRLNLSPNSSIMLFIPTPDLTIFYFCLGRVRFVFSSSTLLLFYEARQRISMGMTDQRCKLMRSVIVAFSSVQRPHMADAYSCDCVDISAALSSGELSASILSGCDNTFRSLLILPLRTLTSIFSQRWPCCLVWKGV